jgi:hypothetical protein
MSLLRRTSLGPLRLRCGALSLGLAAGALGWSGCSKPAARPDPRVLAKVGPVEIRVEDFERELQARLKANRPVPSREELLDEMIQHEALVLKAREAGLENDDAVRRAQRNVLVRELKERELKPRVEAVQVSPEEVAARYQRDLLKYTRPAKVRLAVIYLKADPKMSAERRAELEARIAEARARAAQQPPDNRGFGPLAAEYSEDPASRYKGGDIGWFDVGRTEYRWPTAVLETGAALPGPGAVSEVVRTDKGLFLVARLDTREAVVTPLEQVAGSLRHQLLTEKRRAVEQAFATGVRAAALAAVALPPVHTAQREDPEPPAFP